MFDLTDEEKLKDEEMEDAIAKFFGLPEEILRKYRAVPKEKTEEDNTLGDGI